MGAAERAYEALNYTLLGSKPMRIMWSHRDPAARRSGVGNIFIKNLDKSIDNKALHDTFVAFGNILSCKVAADSSGSKGYGFVHYDKEEAAQLAIEKVGASPAGAATAATVAATPGDWCCGADINTLLQVNAKSLAGKKVYVGPFQKKSERPADGEIRFTNVYVKNLPDSVDDDKLSELFGEFGSVTSAVVMRVRTIHVLQHSIHPAMKGLWPVLSAAAQGARRSLESPAGMHLADHGCSSIRLHSVQDDVDKSRGFGFVNFEDATAARAAVDALDGQEVDGSKLWAGRAQKKSEREAELRNKCAHLLQLPPCLTGLPKLQCLALVCMCSLHCCLPWRSLQPASCEAACRRDDVKKERLAKFQGLNLFIKNLADDVDDERLRTEFAPFGSITSATVCSPLATWVASLLNVFCCQPSESSLGSTAVARSGAGSSASQDCARFMLHQKHASGHVSFASETAALTTGLTSCAAVCR